MRKFDLTTRRGRAWYWLYHSWFEIMVAVILIIVVGGMIYVSLKLGT